MGRIAIALSLLLLSAQVAGAGWMATTCGGAYDLSIRVDWQYPWQLPSRFRNHCAYERFAARPLPHRRPYQGNGCARRALGTSQSILLSAWRDALFSLVSGRSPVRV